MVNLDLVTAELKSLLRERITTLSAGKLQEVDTALKFALGLG